MKSRTSTRPTGEWVTFFTPGILPSAATRPAMLFAPLLRRSACAKKGNQRNTPPVMRSSGILPCESANAANGRASCAASCGLFLRARRITGGPIWAASCRRSQGKGQSKSRSQSRSRSFPRRHLEVVRGCTDSWIPAPFAVPSIAGDGGKCPQGRAHDARASADSTRTYCQTTPPSPRSTGTPRRA
jgi:hypothetical protein